MGAITRIVASMDGGSRDPVVARLGIGLAARFGAEFEAVFARIPPFIPASVDGILTPQIVEAQQAIHQKRADAARRAVESAAKGGVRPIWTAIDGPAATVMISRARFADLVLIGQPPPEESDSVTDYDLPAELVMAAGRPVLVVPYAGDFAEVGKRVLVGWAGTRESARALADALPIMAGASEVTVLMVNPRDDTESSEADMTAWLTRHGLPAKIRTARTSELEVGDVLLSTAADISADLIVMGAYGRSRLRELILGGATHSMLKHMTAPVLMSH